MALAAAVLCAGEEKFMAEKERQSCVLMRFALANVETTVSRALGFVIMIKGTTFKALLC